MLPQKKKSLRCLIDYLVFKPFVCLFDCAAKDCMCVYTESDDVSKFFFRGAEKLVEARCVSCKVIKPDSVKTDTKKIESSSIFLQFLGWSDGRLTIVYSQRKDDSIAVRSFKLISISNSSATYFPYSIEKCLCIKRR